MSLTSSQILSKGNSAKFIELIQRYNKGELVYPGVLIRKLGISQTQAYKVLDMLKEQGILEINYEVYCHECSQFKGPIYETFGKIPEELDCECCGVKLDPLNNSIVIYKMIAD
ncbi:response regulator [Desulfosporosinus sp. OT]|uniref:response regulator n=1 Tax=Desulfosporosinus sp. OT TaxID=913865 RepID=UPI001300C616|nr:response regulator [Desulfosporosinus sp. OT]